jgi:PIF1-like helicase/HRDC domain/UvrD-like helicase C-terminal domain
MNNGDLSDIHNQIICFLENTTKPIFLTGKAGTGKTTFLHYLKQNIPKNIVIAAPTAVAALNAGGMTLHSLFQIPFGPLIPEVANGRDLGDSFKLSREKVILLTKLELLIIDEISMVRADVIDRIDAILQKVKGISLPFGGVQLLMIGDLYQLPPVYQSDWQVLSKYYSNPYFFSSEVFRHYLISVFELRTVYRQNDPEFIEILNSIREGVLDNDKLEMLNKNVKLNPPDFDEYITLTTHNKLAFDLNNAKLTKLEGDLFRYEARVSGDFPEEAYPAEFELLLKKGAQVIFIKNDLSGNNNYYNGRAAKVIGIDETNIRVAFNDDQSEFDVFPEAWQNTKFSLDEQDKKISESSTGTFVQYPLKLAWAITIHKSQGLSFDKVCIDVKNAFAHGQTYVALSRCRRLSGLVLQAPVRPENIIADPVVVSFMSEISKASAIDIQDAEDEQLHQVLYCLLDFSILADEMNLLRDEFPQDATNDLIFRSEFIKSQELFIKEAKTVADKFLKVEFSKSLFLQSLHGDRTILTRYNQARSYILPKLESLNQMLTRVLNNTIALEPNSNFIYIYNSLCRHLTARISVLSLEAESVSPCKMMQLFQDKAIEYKPIFNFNKLLPNAPKVQNLELYEKILAWRFQYSSERNIADYLVIGEQACRAISAKPPNSIIELSSIKGVGKVKAEQFGEELLRILNDHLGSRGLF